MRRTIQLMVFALLSILLGASPGLAQEAEHEEHGEADKDATYFLLRLGVGLGFPIGKSYGIEPQINLDLVEGEKVWVCGVNFIYAW